MTEETTMDLGSGVILINSKTWVDQGKPCQVLHLLGAMVVATINNSLLRGTDQIFDTKVTPLLSTTFITELMLHFVDDAHAACQT